MKEMIKKVINIKNISFKEKIILIATVGVLLMVFTKVLYNLNNDKNGIDYGKDIDVNYISAVSDENNDRKVYSILDRIINNFINSYNLELEDYSGDVELGDIQHTRKDYYEVLNSYYKKKIGRFKYNSLTKEFMQKFIISNEHGHCMKAAKVLKKVYKLSSYEYSENMYLCKLETVNENEVAYIGIQLNNVGEKYNIFYIGMGEIEDE